MATFAESDESDKANYFKCPFCEIVTQHIKVKDREAFTRLYGKGIVSKFSMYVVGLCIDLSGIRKINDILFGVANYKCTKCGHIREVWLSGHNT